MVGTEAVNERNFWPFLHVPSENSIEISVEELVNSKRVMTLSLHKETQETE